MRGAANLKSPTRNLRDQKSPKTTIPPVKRERVNTMNTETTKTAKESQQKIEEIETKYSEGLKKIEELEKVCQDKKALEGKYLEAMKKVETMQNFFKKIAKERGQTYQPSTQTFEKIESKVEQKPEETEEEKQKVKNLEEKLKDMSQKYDQSLTKIDQLQFAVEKLKDEKEKIQQRARDLGARDYQMRIKFDKIVDSITHDADKKIHEMQYASEQAALLIKEYQEKYAKSCQQIEELQKKLKQKEEVDSKLRDVIKRMEGMIVREKTNYKVNAQTISLNYEKRIRKLEHELESRRNPQNFSSSKSKYVVLQKKEEDQKSEQTADSLEIIRENKELSVKNKILGKNLIVIQSEFEKLKDYMGKSSSVNQTLKAENDQLKKSLRDLHNSISSRNMRRNSARVN